VGPAGAERPGGARPRDDEAASGTGTPRREARRDLWKLFAVLLVLTAALRLPAFFVDVFNSDETFLATQAQVINQGGDLYLEAADRKPPLVPYVYAAAFDLFDTTDLWSVRVFAMLAGAGTALLVAMEARRRYGRRASWMAGVLCVLALVAFAPQDGQAANFEIFMLPAMTAAVLLARRGRSASAGVAVAVATLAKQTGAFTLLPVLYLVWRHQRQRGLARAVIGFAVPITLAALAVGPGDLLYWTVLGNGSYISIESARTYILVALILMTLGWVACNLPIVWRLPAAWRTRREPVRDGDTDLDLWLWLASAALAVALGFRFFGHYYLQLVPPLCLLTAGSLVRARRKVAIITVTWAALAAIAFSAAGYFMRPFGPEPDYQAVSNYLAANVTGDNRIFVWGAVPEIYWASGKLPATRFVTTPTFLGGSHPGRPASEAAPEESSPDLWEKFLADLHAHPPQYVLDTSPAGIRGAEYTPISRFPRLQAFIDRGYRFVGSIDRIGIYKRR
jgi:4-amino-4-deoxy-L-arabinose transferase-like glycosyltransferase